MTDALAIRWDDLLNELSLENGGESCEVSGPFRQRSFPEHWLVTFTSGVRYRVEAGGYCRRCFPDAPARKPEGVAG